MRKTRTLNVKKTTNEQLQEKWGFSPNLLGELYIRCNSKGDVNWEKALVYRAMELVDRNNVVIVK